MIYDISERGTHTLKVTLQFRDYVGHIITEISGNCHGRDVLDFDFECCDGEFDNDYISNDCKLKYNQDTDTFDVTLKNDKGEEFTLELSDDEINKMIVGLEFIDFKPEQEG